MRQKIELIRGNTLKANFILRTPEGAPVQIGGATITWRMARGSDWSQIVAEAATGDGISITDAADGRFQLAVPASETAALAPGEYAHAVRVSFANGEVTTVLQEFITVHPSI